jgi:TolA-binding protein
MIRVLLISEEERLANILSPVFDQADVKFETASSWTEGQELLFRDRYDLVAIDYEAVKLEDLDTFVTLDNIFLKEQSIGVLMARSKSERVKQLEEQFAAFHDVVDMSEGKPVFLRKMTLALGQARRTAKSRLSSSTLETDALAQIELDLPVPTDGELRDHQLARLAYTLRIRKESGRFVVANGPKTLTFGFSQGQVVDGEGFEPATSFPEIFAWTTGTFRFDPDEKVEGEGLETVDLILRGVQKYMHQRDLTEALLDSMEVVPIRTNLWEERSERFSNYGALHALVRLCDGRTTLEKVLAGLGSIVNEGFRAAYFALQTDLLIGQPDKIATAAVVLYSREVRQRRQKIADTERQETKAFKATESESGRAEVAAELRARVAEFEKATAHEIFGVWEGCGRKVVQDTFYRLVKEHHPDVYGGNISDEMKKLAQEIFIAVKNSYQELLRKEKEQTVPPPESFKRETQKVEREHARQRSRSLAGASTTGLGENSEAFTRANSPKTSPKGRPLHETPRLEKTSSATPVPENLRTTSGAGRTTSAAGRTTSEPGRTASSAGRRRTSSIPGGEPEEPIDVQEKLKKLSAFKKRRARRRLTSPRARTLSETSEPVQELLDRISEPSQVSEVSDGESSVPIDSSASDAEEQKAEKERKKKLDRLIKKTSQVDDPNAPNPARDAFNRGYKHYKADELEDALKQFALALRFRDDGLYKTFYAYTEYQLDESKAADAIQMLEEVIESKHRQAAPDAHLFLGHILKAGGNHPRAIRHYEEALRLNPKSREAEREVRLAKMRKKSKTGASGDEESDSILKKIFKK